MARASLEELLEDYHDWLRNHNVPIWDKNSTESLYVRKLAAGRIEAPRLKKGTNETDGTHDSADSEATRSHGSPESHSSHPPAFTAFRDFFNTRSPEIVANILICLIHQTNYLLDQQIRQLERAFLEEGGLRERMMRARLNSWKSQRR
ncbi:MAG: four helix bundle suffix domain-containing protein [Verrucomicrobia bacterium]|nr:four helix bundle suffix domain-containing protein [Verrucomicrobiota bacterium]